VDKGRGPKASGIVCRIAKLRWFEPSYYILGEHGNIRYAPRGLREQHEDVVGIYRS